MLLSLPFNTFASSCLNMGGTQVLGCTAMGSESLQIMLAAPLPSGNPAAAAHSQSSRCQRQCGQQRQLVLMQDHALSLPSVVLSVQPLAHLLSSGFSGLHDADGRQSAESRFSGRQARSGANLILNHSFISMAQSNKIVSAQIYCY